MLDNLVRGYHPQLGMKYQKEIKEHYHFGHIAVFPIMIPTDSVNYPKIWNEWYFMLNTFYKTAADKDAYMHDVVEYYLRCNGEHDKKYKGVIEYDSSKASYIIVDLEDKQEYPLHNCIVKTILGNLYDNKEYKNKYFSNQQEEENIISTEESTKDIINTMAEAVTYTDQAKDVLVKEIIETKPKRNTKK